MMNLTQIKELIISINKGGECGPKAVEIAKEQYDNLEELKIKNNLSIDESMMIYSFVLAMNEGHAASFQSHVYWADEQIKKLKEIELRKKD